MFLILLCTLYAFKTRKIPENFNETRLIGFTMYSTSILWLSFGPIYFATQNNFKIQITSLCICISMSGTVALACFFAPKVYIVLFQPYKNVRTRHSAIGKLVNQQMRFISQFNSCQPSRLPARMGIIEISTNCTTSVIDGSVTHGASSSEETPHQFQHHPLGPRPTQEPHHVDAQTSQLSVNKSTVAQEVSAVSSSAHQQVHPIATTSQAKRVMLKSNNKHAGHQNRAVPSVNNEYRKPFMQNEITKRTYDGGGLTVVRNRFNFPKGPIEEESREYSKETTDAEDPSDNEDDDNLTRSLLKRVDSNQQESPPPIQLILYDMSDSFSTFL